MIAKYRNIPPAYHLSPNNVNETLDELKGSFLQLEQLNPGALDLFSKSIIQSLKAKTNN